LHQRDGNQPVELDEETVKRVENEHGFGQIFARKNGYWQGHDFSDVRVHTSSEAEAPLLIDLGSLYVSQLEPYA